MPEKQITVRVPAALRKLTGGAETVELQGGSVGEVIGALVARFPELRPNLLDDAGELRRYVTVFLNDNDIRSCGGLAAPVAGGDEICLVPAIAGG